MKRNDILEDEGTVLRVKKSSVNLFIIIGSEIWISKNFEYISESNLRG